MKGFLATTLVTLAAATKEVVYSAEDQSHSDMLEQNAVVGQTRVDVVVDDPYSLRGRTAYGDQEDCMHAKGHDGTYSYISLTAQGGEEANAGDYTESTTMYNGKHLYVNKHNERFMGWQNDAWGVGNTNEMQQVVDYQTPFTPLVMGAGTGDKPETMEGFEIMFGLDMDVEPEWRCLMRPLLVEGVLKVEEAELSIESKALLEEKRELVAVHERLQVEAEARKAEAVCIEHIEKAMAALEECELSVLRSYVAIADVYPQSWLQLLKEKVVCVDTFALATASCNHLWTDQWERYYEWAPTNYMNNL